MRKLVIPASLATGVLFLLLFAQMDVARCGDQDIQMVDMLSGPSMAPDFILQDLKGKERSLKDYRGKVVLLNFTTTWCPYCKKDIPNLKKLHLSMKGKAFELVSIYVNESPKRVMAFAEKYSLPYTVLVDSDAVVARKYNVRGVPMKVVVDKKGAIGCYQCSSAEDKVGELLTSM
ncbi:MAG: TlpA family protein disulfide reductase [Desulfobacterota bacterium]|nr:TlpA family protein disulfide reductase [Thermodesulfobacteriota bacterium]